MHGLLGFAIGAIAMFIAMLIYYRPIVAKAQALAHAAEQDVARMRGFMKSMNESADRRVDAARNAATEKLRSADAFLGQIAQEYQKLKAGAAHKLDELLTGK